MRWFRDAWLDGERARAEGVDLRAVTSWALFGSQGWDTLLTGEGRYEPGAFDVSSGRPRPTALAGLLPSLASGEVPADLSPGWWRRDLRLHYPAVRVADANSANDELQAPQGAPLLITGASGTLGRAMAAACERRGLAFVLTGRSELDLLDKQSIAAALDRHQPWALINCSGWVRVDDAEDAADACLAVNSDGAAALSRACDQRGVRTLSFSSDLVFSGRKRSAYLERDAVAPRNVYGHSKAQMERYIGGLGGRHLVVRTAAFFSPFDEANFAVHLARSLIRGERFAAAEDYVVTPTYVPDLCDASLDLLIDGETGIWHLSNEEAVSWSDFGARIACGLGHDPALVAGVPGHRIGWRAKRPRASAIASERGALMPSLQSAIDRFCAGFTAREAA